jgi:hypothetical protein
MGGCESRAPKAEADTEERAADRRPTTCVVLNIYDLFILNYTTAKFGIGAYHSGVEVFGRGAAALAASLRASAAKCADLSSPVPSSFPHGQSTRMPVTQKRERADCI